MELYYYSIGDRDQIYAQSIEEAVDEFLDDFYSLEGVNAKPPKAVDVVRWKKIEIGEIPSERLLEDLIETLDENYGNPEYCSDFKPSEDAMALLTQFLHMVSKEYPVWAMEEAGDPIPVDIAQYIEEDSLADHSRRI